MKKILTGLLTASLLTGGLVGCNNKLNVQPVSSIDTANAFNTSDDVHAALIGCYKGLQSTSLYGGDWQLMTDLLADNGDEMFVGTYSQPQQAQRKTLLYSNSFISSTWLSAYDVINRTNNVLANLSKLSTPAQQSSVEGEAKFIRSMVYFDLVRSFARDWNDGTPANNPGVPLVLTPTTSISEASSVKRNTVAEVYTQIITDLNTAESKLPASNGFFANKYAAAGLLARIYLQQSNFSAAAAAANRVISSNRFSLNPGYADNFVSNSSLLANTSEDIFALQFSAQSGTNDLNTFYSQNRRADVEIQPQFVKLFEAGDDRKNLYQPNANSTYYTTKYDVLYGNIKLIRLDEMYLIRAEANLRAGTQLGDTPVNDINVIRQRAQLAPLATVTLADILKERRLELAFEGFRLGDIKRNQQSAFDPLTNTTLAWNSPKLVFPIPLREINANPNLVQNPGY
ncbi:RagB/SusD family nutrient uptake outer membrane protein [Hymenobacter ginsengisoli]|uniref:RagB/SusD family nutrient uptake outer membrane protein n=1 Tax=Hymenobacter ginsengisoli TaxID=1051626 RepID=A0ABP8QDM8_9BACT|nr:MULTISPECIES: RagB/SusD family nutrient uptake outer membrane protein [unclassified Hymenobacter]MBO2031570.1 RagB/SusD family nutrient uptake outer membrane protein [Hymenobacter sp. BT559]